MMTAPPDEQQIMAEIKDVIGTVLEGYAPDADEIGPQTTFGDDLEMESIDLVTLSGLLTERFGPQINFAAYLAELDLDEIIDLRVGEVVAYVLRALGPQPGTGD
ncbi:acyl carrier protein [Streptomyces sp. NPDC020800]|uniref:acyl carrier protein n=1 Tax=Streptomyces sp. NPDC020800 TaxID=3365092 RepID=UPI00379C4EE6